MNMSEEKFPQAFYDRCVELYSRHRGKLSWHQAQQLAQQEEHQEAHAYASTQAREDYARELPTATADERFAATLDYQRHNPHLSFQEAQEALGEGETFVDVPLALDSSGLATDRPARRDYMRQPRQGKFAQAELQAVAAELDCTLDEAEKFLDHYLGLIRSGKQHDSAWAESMSHVFAPARQHKPPPAAGPMDSHPSEPRHQRVAGQSAGSSGQEGFFVPSANAWSQEHATVAPPREIPMRTSGPGAGARGTRAAQSIPPPAGPGLSPLGYSRRGEPELDERALEQILTHMRDKGVGFEEARMHYEEQEKKKLARSLGNPVGKRKLPAGAPVGHPPPQQHESAGPRYDYGRPASAAEAAHRSYFDLPGRPCVGFSYHASGDGGTIAHPLYG
jgi:hypothetical protein